MPAFVTPVVQMLQQSLCPRKRQELQERYPNIKSMRL